MRILVLFLLLPWATHAQPAVDSLRLRLKDARGMERAEILEALARQEKNTNLEIAFLHANQALKIAEEEHDDTRTQHILSLLGSLKRSASSYDSARLYYYRALELARRSKNAASIAENLNSIGITFQNQGNLTKALDHYLEALDMATKAKDTRQTANAYTNIGFIYKIQKDLDQALAFFEKALVCRQTDNDTQGIAGAYNNIGLIHMARKKYDEARDYYLRSMALIQEADNPREMAMLYNNIGITYENQGQFEEGRVYYLKSIALKEKMNDERGLASTYGNIADNYYEDRQPEQAIRFARLSLQLAEKTQSLEYMVTATRILAFAHERMRNFEDAFYFHVKHKALQDSLFDATKSRQIADMVAKYNTVKKEEENAFLKTAATLSESRLNKQQIVILVVGSGLGLVLLLLTFLYQLYQRSRTLAIALTAQKKEIENTNLQLQEVLQEKNTLMSIVAHDLRSPLNKVLGLTQLVRLEGPVTIQQQTCLEMISSVADHGRKIINDLLTIDKEGKTLLQLSVITLSEFLEAILRQHVPEAKRKNIALTLTLTETRITVTSDPDALSRILDNLISNAIKFSPAGKSVNIEACTLSDKKIYISVRDEGPGFSEEDKKDLFKKFKRLSAQPTGGEPSTGLGLAIVKDLVSQLGGEINLISSQHGALFEIILPVELKKN